MSVQGRAVLDTLRTILQTAVAAGAPPHAYLIDVFRASPADNEAHQPPSKNTASPVA
jgi:hypothetical protein